MKDKLIKLVDCIEPKNLMVSGSPLDDKYDSTYKKTYNDIKKSFIDGLNATEDLNKFVFHEKQKLAEKVEKFLDLRTATNKMGQRAKINSTIDVCSLLLTILINNEAVIL